MPNTEDKFKMGLITTYLAFMVIGTTFLFSANLYREKFHGELVRVEVYSDTSCTTSCNSEGKNCRTSCSDEYYIHEIFRKRPDGNSTSTCTVERPRIYYFKGDADNVVSRTKLGTRRRLYETLTSHGTCYDDKIKRTWNIVGSVFLALPNFLILCVFIFAGIFYIKDKTKELISSNEMV